MKLDDSTGPIELLVEGWQSQGVLLEPPASEAQLRALEDTLATPLPADIAAFYRRANGMRDLEYDHHQMSFWSIPKIMAQCERSSGTDPNGPFNDLAIADFLINSWFISLRVRRGMVTIFIEGSAEELPSLSAFAARYIEAPDSLPVL